jgi:plasmid stabilization system protein ParE
MIRIRFLPAAEAEILREIAYYSNARVGTGIKFQMALTAAIEAITLHPDRSAPATNGTRSRIVQGFPFNVIYKIDAVELLIVAVSHHRRRPGYWESRIE